MANHRAAALLIAFLVVAVAVADARLVANNKHHNAKRLVAVHPNARLVAKHLNKRLLAKHPNARLTVHLGASGAHFVSDAAPAVPALSCNTVHGVQKGETCFSVAQGAGLTQDDFLGFNPNINCDKVFVGQWVCLAAVPAA